MFLKRIALTTAGAALAAFGFVATAQATPTNVNVSSPGKGVIATDVAEFDWSSTGSGLSIGVGPFGTPLTVGQQFAFHGFRFEVVRRRKNRILALRLSPLETAEPASDQIAK